MKLTFTIDKKFDLSFIENQDDLINTEKQYQLSEEAMAYTVSEYQKSWNMINDDFSHYIEETTQHSFAHEEYFCIVSPVHQGISNWDGSNKIIRWWKENPFAMRRITAHELIIHHYFSIIKKSFSQENISETQIWALAEIAGFALTSLTPQTKLFWPWDTSGYYTDHNYQSIVPLQKQLEKVFLARRDFNEYIRKGIDAVKSYNQPIGFF